MREEDEKYNLKLHLHKSELVKVSDNLREEFDKAKPKLVMVGIDQSSKSDFGKLIILGTIGHNHFLLPLEMNWEPIDISNNIETTIQATNSVTSSSEDMTKAIKEIAACAKNTFKVIEETPKKKGHGVIPKNYYKKKW